MKGWAVFRTMQGDQLGLALVGTSDAKERDRAILDCATAGGEYVAVPLRYMDAAIVHSEPHYSISARSRKVFR